MRRGHLAPVADPALPLSVTVTAAPAPAQPLYLTLEELAERHRTTYDAIRMRIAAGTIPTKLWFRPKGTRRILVRRKALEQWEARGGA